MQNAAAHSARSTIIIVGLLVALTWLVFGQTLYHDFINFDDNKYVYENVRVSSGLSATGVASAFTQKHNNLWHPLTTLSNMLDCQLFGLKAGGHHFTNVVLHTLAVLLLFFVLREMTGRFWGSAFVAAIFAIHPLRVESVAWIAERKDVLSGVFFMLTLGAYVRYARRPTIGRYLTMSILYACGLMSKAMLVTVPVILLLLDYWPLERLNKVRAFPRLLIEKVPLFLLAFGSAIATVGAQTATINSAGTLSVWWRFSRAVVTLMIYIGQMFWPANLAIFYPHGNDQTPLWRVAASAAAIAIITIAAFVTSGRQKYFLVGWFWYVVMLLPVLGIVGVQGYADRFTYLPQIGLSILLTWSINDLTQRWPHREIILSTVAAMLIVLLTVCAFRQTSFWRDSITLWTRTLAVTSNNETAQWCIASALLERGRLDEAIAHSQAAVAIRPEKAGAYGKVPVVLTDEQTQAAIARLTKRLETYPRSVDAHNNLGVILYQSGDARAAVNQWEMSLAIAPNDGNAQNNLAWVLATYPDDSIRDGAKAVMLAESAVRLAGGENPIVLRTLAGAYAEDGQFAKAAETAQRAADLATTQKNPSLGATLRGEMARYRENQPHREVPKRAEP